MKVFPSKGMHVVYRVFSSNGALLYVGRSGDLRNRIEDHAYRQAWWCEVAGFTWELCPSRADAIVREATVIRTERPKYNTRPGGEVEPMVMCACRLPLNLIEALHAFALQQGRTMSDVHRELLIQGLRPESTRNTRWSRLRIFRAGPRRGQRSS